MASSRVRNDVPGSRGDEIYQALCLNFERSASFRIQLLLRVAIDPRSFSAHCQEKERKDNPEQKAINELH